MDQLLHLLLLLLLSSSLMTIAWWNCEGPLASGMRQSKSASKAGVSWMGNRLLCGLWGGVFVTCLFDLFCRKHLSLWWRWDGLVSSSFHPVKHSRWVSISNRSLATMGIRRTSNSRELQQKNNDVPWDLNRCHWILALSYPQEIFSTTPALWFYPSRFTCELHTETSGLHRWSLAIPFVWMQGM